MALPSSGAIKLSDVNVELGLGSTTQRGLGQASTRTLYGVASGAIRLAADGYGKANEFTFSITSNQTNYNLRTAALAAGWPGTAKVVATVSPGVYIYGNSTGTPGLTIDGAWPGGVALVNNGYILGQGGNGGTGQNGLTYSASNSPGASGGTALSVSTPTSITNNGTIGGGGGGGGGGGRAPWCDFFDTSWGGGGGGGGQTGLNNSSGGSGGNSYSQQSRGASPGGTGTYTGAGGGGQSGAAPNPSYQGGPGGAGGGWGTSGTSGTSIGGSGTPGTSGGGAGNATSGAPTYVTWVTTGTRYGPIG